MHLDSDQRVRLKARTQQEIDEATRQHDGGMISRAQWQELVADALARAYLDDDDPRWQSGFDGDERLWREARSLVLDAAPTEGAFLDVGCANGYLLESLGKWSAERGQHLELYGLELNPRLADAARRRLPALASRIFTGNVSTWMPPRRFDCVRTGLEYAPGPEEQVLLVRHVVSHLLSDSGRLLVGPVSDDSVPATSSVFERAGLSPRVTSSTDHRGKTRHVVWAERSG